MVPLEEGGVNLMTWCEFAMIAPNRRGAIGLDNSQPSCEWNGFKKSDGCQ